MDEKSDNVYVVCPKCKAKVNLDGEEVQVYTQLGIPIAVAFDCPACKQHVIKNLMEAYQEWKEGQKCGEKSENS